MSAPLVLIVDDSELLLQILQMICEQAGYRTACALNLSEALALLAAERPAVILSDLNLPDVADPVSALRAHPAALGVPIVLISAQEQVKLDAIAADRGAQAALSKDAGMPGMMAALPPLLAHLVALDA